VHRGLQPCPHVEGEVVQGASRGERGLPHEEVGPDHVTHVDVVAGLLPVAEDRERLAREEPLGEDGHDAGLPVGVLAGPEDVGVPERHGLDSVETPVVVQVHLRRELGHAVGGGRELGGGLHGGPRNVLAVDHPAGRHVDDPGGDPRLADAVPNALEKVQETEDVDGGIAYRIHHRYPHVHLGGVVVHQVEPGASAEVPGLGTRDRGLQEPGDPVGHVGPLSRGEIIHHPHLVPPGHVRLGHVPPDEPGASRN
jgi:hypothetical protein